MRAARFVVLAGVALFQLVTVMKEARGGHFVVLKEGTPVSLKLTIDVDDVALLAGEKVPMVVAEKVTSEGFILIEAGASVEATFIPGKRNGTGLLKILSVQAADGQDVMLRAAPAAAETPEDRDSIDQLTILITTGNQRLPEGATFKVYLSETYFIED